MKPKRAGKNKGGRPTVITEQVVDKLEEAFKIGCTDEEACLSADIDKKTLYNYIKKNPSFSTRKQQLKANPVFLAKKTIVDKLEKDVDIAKWYLERRKKDEFSTKTEIDNNHQVEITGINYITPKDKSEKSLK